VWAHDAQPHNARLTWSSTDFGRLRAYELRNPGLRADPRTTIRYNRARASPDTSSDVASEVDTA